MKRGISFFLGLALAIGCAFSVFAAPAEKGPERIDLGNGYSVVITTGTTAGSARAQTSNYCQGTYYCGSTKIGTVTLHATFNYDGSTVSVQSAYATYVLATGWAYKNQTITKSGGTAHLTVNLVKSGYATVPVSLSLTCDKDGNVS